MSAFDSAPVIHPLRPATKPGRPPGSRWRWVGWGALGLAILLGLGLLLLDPWLRRTLERQVADRSQGRYQLRIDALHTSLWQRGVQLRGIHLRPAADANLWQNPEAGPRLLADVSRLRISGVGIGALLRGGVVPIDSVVLAGSRLRILQLPPASASPAPPLYSRLPGKIAGLRVGYVGIDKLQAAYGPARTPLASLREGSFSAQDVLLSKAGAADSGRLGYAAAVSGRLRGLAVAEVLRHRAVLARAQFSSRTQRLSLDSVQIWSLDKQGPRGKRPKVTLTLAQLRLTGLQPGQLKQRELHLDSLALTALRLTFTPPSQPPPALYKLLAPYARRLTLAHVALTRGYVHIAGTANEPTVRHLEVQGHALRIDAAAAQDPSRIFYAQQWQARTGLTTAVIDAPIYKASYQSLRLNTRAKSLLVADIFVVPTLSPTGVNRLKHHQAPHITLHLPQLRVTGLNYAALDQHGALLAQQVAVRRLRLLLDGDGHFPINPKPSLVTPETLGKLPIRLNVRRLVMSEANLRTSYLSPSSNRRGTVTFDHLNGTLTNLTNDPRLMTSAHPLVAHVTGLIANKWQAEARFWLPLLAADGGHWGEATFGPASITLLNSMTEEARLIRFASGNVHRARVRFEGNRDQITGTMLAEYDHLKLTVLSKKGGANHKTILTRVESGLLNAVVIRDENPRHEDKAPKPGSMTSRRDLRTSVFSLWRQGLVSGLLNSIGAPKKLAQKISEAE